MSILVINNKSQFNSQMTEKLLKECFTIAANKVGSMRGVFQGDMQNTIQANILKKSA